MFWWVFIVAGVASFIVGIALIAQKGARRNENHVISGILLMSVALICLCGGATYKNEYEIAKRATEAKELSEENTVVQEPAAKESSCEDTSETGAISETETAAGQTEAFESNTEVPDKEAQDASQETVFGLAAEGDTIEYQDEEDIKDLNSQGIYALPMLKDDKLYDMCFTIPALWEPMQYDTSISFVPREDCYINYYNSYVQVGDMDALKQIRDSLNENFVSNSELNIYKTKDGKTAFVLMYTEKDFNHVRCYVPVDGADDYLLILMHDEPKKVNLDDVLNEDYFLLDH